MVAAQDLTATVFVKRALDVSSNHLSSYLSISGGPAPMGQDLEAYWDLFLLFLPYCL